jgi:hypothetical protein
LRIAQEKVFPEKRISLMKEIYSRLGLKADIEDEKGKVRRQNEDETDGELAVVINGIALGWNIFAS